MFLCLSKTNSHNLTVDNTIPAAGKTNKKLIYILKGSKLAIDFFKAKIMLVTQNNLDDIAITRNSQILDTDVLQKQSSQVFCKIRCS